MSKTISKTKTKSKATAKVRKKSKTKKTQNKKEIPAGKTINLFVSGTSRGNSKASSTAFFISDTNNKILEHFEWFTGYGSKTKAALQGFIRALEYCSEKSPNLIKCHVSNINIARTVKKLKFTPYSQLNNQYRQLRHLRKNFPAAKIKHINLNDPKMQYLDSLMTRALDHHFSDKGRR